LINGIKVAYGTKKNKTFFAQHKAIFDTIERNMQLLEKKLEWVGSNDTNENKAIELLAILAKFVRVTARKASSNLIS